MNAYVGPTVSGAVTIEFVNVPGEEAVQRILALQKDEYSFKIVDWPGSVLLVVAPVGRSEELPYEISPRHLKLSVDPVLRDYFLKNAESAQIVAYLTGPFPGVEFFVHPGKNSFSACGSREDLERIKAALAELDRPPECFLLPVR